MSSNAQGTVPLPWTCTQCGLPRNYATRGTCRNCGGAAPRLVQKFLQQGGGGSAKDGKGIGKGGVGKGKAEHAGKASPSRKGNSDGQASDGCGGGSEKENQVCSPTDRCERRACKKFGGTTGSSKGGRDTAGKGGTTGHATRLAESEKYLAWVEQAGNEAMVAAATAYIEELRQERAQVQEGARDGLSSARLRKAETRLRKAEAQLKAAEDAVEKKAVELAEAESRREDCEDKVDNLRAELQRARLELGAGTEQAQALAVCAERVETTWDAFPAALHAGNSDAAMATLTQCIGELLAAVRAVNGSGSGEERGEKRRRDAKESGAIDPQEAGESEEDADIGNSDDDQPLEPPTAYTAGRGSTEGLRRKGGKDRRDGARISKAA